MADTSGMRQTIYAGTFIHCKSLKELDICEQGAIGVDEHGRIAFIERNSKDVESIAQAHGWNDAIIIRASSRQFFFPGFIDTHIHASQYPNAGIFGKSTLLDWLNTYTFPLESSLGNVDKARTVYERCVSRTLSHGTTTASYFATAHVASTNLLADICLAAGQRAFIGRCCMDSLSPDFYRDASPASAIADTQATVDHVARIDPQHALVCPIITPRFAPSCTSPLLHRLGRLVKDTGLPMQTHLSENKAECALVHELFPDAPSYTAVYDMHGLLGPRSVLAHAVHLSPAERALIAAREAKISHCPVSNSALSSGPARVRSLLEAGVTVGLGTDVSGGYSVSVLEAARQAVLVSRHVSLEDGDAAKLSLEEALHLATRGGAKVMALEDKVGAFQVGMEWDAQLVSLALVDQPITDGVRRDEGPVDIFGWESWEERVAKWVYAGDDRNTSAVWVRGRLVHGNL